MKSVRIFVGLALTAVFIFLFIFFRREVSGFLGNLRQSPDLGRQKSLEVENKLLREELSRLEGSEKSIFSSENSYERAKVYSRYPFNDRRLLIIDAGGRDRIKVGMPVFASEGILLGKVESVMRTQSVVETIFNPEWRSSVRLIGDGSKALLRGGLPPVLELIPREAKIKEGDAVLNTSPEYPIDSRLGTLGEIKPVLNEAWLGAEVVPPYELEEIGEVLVLLNFP